VLAIVDGRKCSCSPKSAPPLYRVASSIGRGARAKTNREKFHRLKTKFWIISESSGGPFIATIQTDVSADFLKKNGGRALAGCGQKSK
jgi:hypothetical protein